MKNNYVFQCLLYLIQGAIVGVGAILPGVSGGVLCVAFGVYEPMMELLTRPLVSVKKYYKLFIPFGIGWVVGFVLLAKAVEWLFAISAPVALLLFFGLICGTLPQLFKTSENSDRKKSWTPFILSLTLAYLVLHFLEHGTGITVQPSVWVYLICGGVWGLSMIIPGLSSSSFLIYLGLYEPMTAALGSLDMTAVIPMLIGIGVTAIAFARLVNMLFQKHYAVISRIILGFVIASSLKILPAEFSGVWELVISLACFAAGFAVALGMDKAQEKQKQ